MATPTRVAGRRAAAEPRLTRRLSGTSRTRTVVVVICLLTVATLFGAVARQAWASTTSAAEVVRLEANGAEMLHPMTSLLTELVTAQSAAVRGAEVDQTSLRSVLAELQEPDALYGEDLQTTQRLADLTEQIEAAFGANETGRAAYQRYSSIVDLAVDLIGVIGDTSHLIHDPNLDSYYLMDAAIARLPHAMVYAGRAADLVALAGGTGVLTGEDAVRAAVARFNVSYDAEQVSLGLTTSVDFTARSELGSNIVARLDTFRAAADAFAPPTMLQELATTVEAGAMADNASRVFAAAQSLAHLLLEELEALLAVRAEGLAQQQRLTATATVAAAIVGAVMFGLLVLPGRRRGAGRDEEPGTGGRGFSAVGREVAAGQAEPAARGRPGRFAAAIMGSESSPENGAAPSGFPDPGSRSGGHAR